MARGVATTVRKESRVSKARKRQQIIDARVAGKSIEQIAGELGMREQSVQNVISQWYAKRRETSLSQLEDTRAQHLAQAEAEYLELYADRRRRDDEGNDTGPNLAVYDRMRALRDQHAKIAGTFAPQRVAHSGEVNHTFDRAEIDRMEEAWREGSVEGSAVEIEQGGPEDADGD